MKSIIPFCVLVLVALKIISSTRVVMAQKERCIDHLSPGSIMRMIRDLSYEQTPARYLQYHIDYKQPMIDQKGSPMRLLSFTTNPYLLQLITPESRAFTAGYILSDVLVKNLTIHTTSPCRDTKLEMTQFLDLAIALNSTTVKEADPDNLLWINDLIANTSQLSSTMHVCVQKPVRGFLYELIASKAYTLHCCYRDDGSLDDPTDSTTKCVDIEYSYKLVQTLEAVCVLFLLFLSLFWLQSRMQNMIHKIKSDSLIFTYITSDTQELGGVLPQMLFFAPYVNRVLYFLQQCWMCLRTHRQESIEKLQLKADTLSLRIPYFVLRMYTLFLIVFLSFARFVIPSALPDYRDLDSDSVHRAIGYTGDLRQEFKDNFSVNGTYIISWGVLVAVFFFTMILQIYAFTPERWFDYDELEEERTKHNSVYLSRLVILTQIWNLILCALFLTGAWIVIPQWNYFTRIIFSIIGLFLFNNYSKSGLTFPKYLPHMRVMDMLLLWARVGVSFLVEAVCMLSFTILSYLAARTFFSLIWYNVLNVVLYSTRLPVMIFCATLLIILQNLTSDISLPFDIFFNVLLSKATDCMINLSERNITLSCNEQEKVNYKSIKDEKKMEPKGDPEYKKVTLSIEHLEFLLSRSKQCIISDDISGDDYYIVTLELCNKIYNSVISNYKSEKARLVFKYMFCGVVSSITFVAFWYISVFNNFALDQLSNVAIIATGFLPQLLGLGEKDKITAYVERRIDGAIEMEMENRNCAGVELGVLYNLKDRSDIYDWIAEQSKKFDEETTNEKVPSNPLKSSIGEIDEKTPLNIV